ncbi:hypothetical protein NIES2100_30270 [Calothrix sp. NIES-2100]|uniref:hypothetical protein n=1 Tax=Calothrix sp. NIES-2100 TaxID=1954172 RepID=UPI000B5F0AA1|nr:hypothetical protein NIES2100_30270 [Calothrix sp. NIES-2100]
MAGFLILGRSDRLQVVLNAELYHVRLNTYNISGLTQLAHIFWSRGASAVGGFPDLRSHCVAGVPPVEASGVRLAFNGQGFLEI